MDAKEYDFIFLGAGCASLSIIARMIDSNCFADKKILIIDKEAKNKNDRTWCFWENEINYFETIVYKKWKHLTVRADTDILPLAMEDYQYKMIRGIDFYEYCIDKIQTQKNIDTRYGNISFYEPTILINGEPLLINDQTIVFNSVYVPQPGEPHKFYLLQHFTGWIIETEKNHFDPDEATLMDFRVSQHKGTTFIYTLPLSGNSALVEYTIFSEGILSHEEYDSELASYLEKYLQIRNYRVKEKEFGVIPMTNANLPFYKNGMYHIGTAGGKTKPSTGYTFRFIQQEAEHIVNQLSSGKKSLSAKRTPKRFLFYDSTLLHILSKKLLDGKIIFTTLFKKNKASQIFRFLDNKSTLKEEVSLLNTLSKKIFIRAGARELIKLMRRK